MLFAQPPTEVDVRIEAPVASQVNSRVDLTVEITAISDIEGASLSIEISGPSGPILEEGQVVGAISPGETRGVSCSFVPGVPGLYNVSVIFRYSSDYRIRTVAKSALIAVGLGRPEVEAYSSSPFAIPGDEIKLVVISERNVLLTLPEGFSFRGERNISCSGGRCDFSLTVSAAPGVYLLPCRASSQGISVPLAPAKIVVLEMPSDLRDLRLRLLDLKRRVRTMCEFDAMLGPFSPGMGSDLVEKLDKAEKLINSGDLHKAAELIEFLEREVIKAEEQYKIELGIRPHDAISVTVIAASLVLLVGVRRRWAI